MYFFQQIGLHTTNFLNSIILFFVFLGHLCHAGKDFILRRLTISWFNVVKILYYQGAALVIPLTVISGLMGMSLGLNAYLIFSRFGLQHKALAISQDILTQDLLPLLIGFILCVQSSLNLISAQVKITHHRQTPEEVVLDYILPIMIGIDVTALLLFTYTVTAIFISLFLTFHFILNFTTQEYLLTIGRNITMYELFYSVVKTLAFCTIVSLSTGYYYYQVAMSQISSRKGVSRILTRGSLWLALASVYVKFINF